MRFFLFSISTTSWVNPTTWKLLISPTPTAHWTTWVTRAADWGFLFGAHKEQAEQYYKSTRRSGSRSTKAHPEPVVWSQDSGTTVEVYTTVHPYVLFAVCCLWILHLKYWCGFYWLAWDVASCQLTNEHIDSLLNHAISLPYTQTITHVYTWMSHRCLHSLPQLSCLCAFIPGLFGSSSRLGATPFSPQCVQECVPSQVRTSPCRYECFIK